MKLQIKIAKQVFKSLKNINIILISSLLLYFIIFIIVNKYDYEYFKYIFGIKLINNSMSLVLFCMNLSYIVYITFKFVSYEYSYMPYEVMLRFNSKQWFIEKLVILSFFILILKIIQVTIFNALGYIFLENYYFDFNFFLENIIYFIDLGVIFMCFLSGNNKIINIIMAILILLSIKLQIIELTLLSFIVLLISLFSFNFKKINSMIKF